MPVSLWIASLTISPLQILYSVLYSVPNVVWVNGMNHYLKLISNALASGQPFTSYRFSDPLETARPLLCSTSERDRMQGLRKLRLSQSPEAQHLALVSYRFAATLRERMCAENCLVALASRSTESVGDTALAILHTQSLSSGRFVSQRILARSVRNLSQVLDTGRISGDDLRAIDKLLVGWEQRSTCAYMAKGLELLEKLSDPWLRYRDAEALQQSSSRTFASMNSRLQLTYALQAVSSEQADKLRAKVLHALEPGAYANVALKTMRAHIGRPLVQRAAARLLNDWTVVYGVDSPPTRRIQELLRIPPSGLRITTR